jgi:hypothetical protein
MEILTVLSSQVTLMVLAIKVSVILLQDNFAIRSKLNLICMASKLSSQIIHRRCTSHSALLLLIIPQFIILIQSIHAFLWYSILTQASFSVLILFWALWCSKTLTPISILQTQLQESIKY